MSSLVRIRLIAAALLTATACGGETSPPPIDAPTDGFDRNAMLAHWVTHVFMPNHEALAVDAAALVPAVTALCDTLDTATDPTAAQTAMQAAFARTMVAQARVDAVLIGPAAMDAKALRDRIYAWPLIGTCAIDRDVAARWQDPAAYDVESRLNNARSLTAVEYLLFPIDVAHTCPTVPAGWDALGADLPRARCRLAEALVADVAAQAEVAANGWRTTGGNYGGQLATAGMASSTITSAHEGVNIVSDGAFFIDSMVKDMKLGEAAGIQLNACGTVGTSCLREAELRFARLGKPAIAANLEALREVFTGTTSTADGPGFDDFLTAVGATDVATRMTASLDAAIAAVDAIPADMVAALEANDPSLVPAHAAVKAFTDDMKSQFLTVLALDIPDDVAADND